MEIFQNFKVGKNMSNINNLPVSGKPPTGNIYLLLGDIMATQKNDNLKYKKPAILAYTSMLKEVHTKLMKDWEEKAEKINDKEDAKLPKNERLYRERNVPTVKKSVTGTIIAGSVTLAAGILATGFLLTKLGMAAFSIPVVGVALAATLLAVAVILIGIGATLSQISAGQDDNFHDEINQDVLNGRIQDAKQSEEKARQKQMDISQALQIRFEPVQSAETAAMNVLTSVYKWMGMAYDFNNRG